LKDAKGLSRNNRADFEPCLKLWSVMKAVTHLDNFRNHCRSPASKIERLFPDGPKGHEAHPTPDAYYFGSR